MSSTNNQDLSQTLRVASLMDRSVVNGPGERTVIWLQGCPFRCIGCFNQDFLPMTGGKEYSVRALVDYVTSVHGTDGVTFSGGEPLAQAKSLLPLLVALHETGMGIVLFTGFEHDDAVGDPDRKRVLEMCDLVIAGPYLKDQPSMEPLRSSANQRLLFLSDRYDQASLMPPHHVHEFTISMDGTTSVTGFPTA